MALFKIFRGSSSQLGKAPTDSNKIDTRTAKTGYCYFTTDDGKFYIDIADGNDLDNNRICLNAHKADQWADVINVNGLTIDGTADRVNYATCVTGSSTANKIVNCEGYTLITGAEIAVKFNNLNTASKPTLNVNNTGAKSICYQGKTDIGQYLATDRIYTFRYNGNQYELVGGADANVIQESTNANSNYHLLLAYSTDIASSAANIVRKNSKLYYNPSIGLLVSPSFSGALDGHATSAGTAEAFASAKTIKLTGDITGTASSTGGWSIATTLKSTGVSAGVYGLSSNITPAFGESFSIPYINVDAQGRINSAATNTVKLPTINNLTFVNNSGVITKKYNASEEVMVKAGTNIRFSLATNVNNVPVIDISAINTTYTANTGIKLDGTVFKHSNSITAGTASEGGNGRTLTYGEAFKIPSISYDAQGHITSVSATELTLPASVLTDAKDYADNVLVDAKDYADNVLADAKDYADNEIAALVNSAPETLDTLKELADALGNDENFAASVAEEIGKKVDKTITITAQNGLTGGGDLSSNITIGHANSSLSSTPSFSDWGSSRELSFGAAFTIPNIVFDAYGHITSWSPTTLSLPQQYRTRLLIYDNSNGVYKSSNHSSLTDNDTTYLRLFDSTESREAIQVTGGEGINVRSQGGVITIESTGGNADVIAAGDNNFTGTNNFAGTTELYGPITLSPNNYGTGAPSDLNQLYFVEDNGITVPAPANNTNGYVLTSNGSAPVWSTNIASGIKTSANSNTIYVTGVASSTNTSLYYNNNVKIQNNVLMGAAWNDYAEYRICKDNFKPGQVICENGDDTLSISIERLQPGAEIVSDTFGFAIGETEDAKCPVAVSGRVLAYTYEPREEFKAGDAVCAGPNGTVSKMTREEIREYPDRIIGTVSAIPSYEIWNETVKVNNRIWIKIK